MLRRIKLSSLAIGLILLVGAATAPAQTIAPNYEREDYDRARIDRYLDVEVWSNHSDGEYYDGDNIVVHFRVNRDAFVAIYSIDTRGRVNLLFPTYEGEDNFVYGGVTYNLPGDQADYDLEVSGPEGFENIQIIASREAFEIPGWYNGPELVDDSEDRDEFMDWINATYFVRYDGQRFAYDRAVIYVNEWEDYYFRPVYHPIYPSWTMYGNVYIDYPWGATIYVNGIYWGCAPLYIPRIAVGWHTITVYDRHGGCWEHDFHVSRYNTAVFNKTIINTSPTVVSKYKEVRDKGYRSPANNGYPDYSTHQKTWSKTSRGKTGSAVNVADIESPAKKHVRGSTDLVKTDRGYETNASTAIFPSKVKSRQGSTSRTQSGYSGSTGKSTSRHGSGSISSDRGSSKSTLSGRGSSSGKSGSSSSGSRLKGSGSSSSGSSTRRKTTGATQPKKGSSTSSTKVDKSSSSSGSTKTPAKVSTPPKSSSGSSGTKSGESKSSSGKSSSGGKSSSKSGGKSKGR